VESKGKSYHYDKVQQVQQVPEPLPVADEKPDWDGISIVITAISGLIVSVTGLIGAVKGKRMWNDRIERKKRETDQGAQDNSKP
jgi:hypothetical protein